jgi:hypothetical protein
MVYETDSSCETEHAFLKEAVPVIVQCSSEPVLFRCFMLPSLPTRITQAGPSTTFDLHCRQAKADLRTEAILHARVKSVVKWSPCGLFGCKRVLGTLLPPEPCR